jgi:hypothetical protein
MRSKGRLLFVDLEKAFDKVDRHKLLRVLQERCGNDQDRHLVDLIRGLLSNTKALFGELRGQGPSAGEPPAVDFSVVDAGAIKKLVTRTLATS